MISRELNGRVPLIGFSGSPWTLATYMIEGQSSRDFIRAKTMLYTQPEVLHQLLEKLSLSVIDYLNAQILAGAQVVQIFDTWGGALSHDAYLEFSLAYMKKIVDGLIKHADGRDVPVILFTKGGGHWLEAMADSGCDCLGLDWTVDIGAAKGRVGSQVALQGNMDPAVLRSDREGIESEVKTILKSFGDDDGHVFNLGHGITPDINPDNVKIFIDAVHKFSGSN
jgi:uroporphyrinogen decarboxylase